MVEYNVARISVKHSHLVLIQSELANLTSTDWRLEGLRVSSKRTIF